MPASQRIEHPFGPVFDENSQVLVLGTMPSPASREQGFYYAHPRNRFWQLLSRLFDEPLARTKAQRIDQLLRHHIALWDVLASCDIEGAADSSIRNPVPNELERITRSASIRAVFCTGAKAAQAYRRFCEPELGIPCVQLPSTSPANAAASLDALVAGYQALADALDEKEAPCLELAQVVELEQALAASGTPLLELMERAGAWIAHRALKRLEAGPWRSSVLVLCGKGNNGGDGWMAARILAEAGLPVTLVSTSRPEELHARPAKDAALACLPVLQDHDARLLFSPSREELEAACIEAGIVIDAILGTGFSGTSVEAPFSEWIEAAGRARENGAYVISADVPSGLSAQSGRASRPCIKADETVTMLCLKPGLTTPWSFAWTGRLTIGAIAYAEKALEDMKASGSKDAKDTSKKNGAKPLANGRADAFARAETEDDDGYDPYSDRPPTPEALFSENPWN